MFLSFSVVQGFCEFSLHSFDSFPKAKGNIRVIVSFRHKDGDCVLPGSIFSFKVCKIPKPEASLFSNRDTSCGTSTHLSALRSHFTDFSISNTAATEMGLFVLKVIVLRVVCMHTEILDLILHVLCVLYEMADF